MSDARAKVLELLAKGTITSDEAEQLLAAMQPDRPPWWTRLLNPMELGTPIAVVLVAVTLAISLALHPAGIRFDGPFDTHWVPSVPPWSHALLATVLNWIGVALLLFAAARIFAKRGRLTELLLVVGVARLPLVIGGVLVALVASSMGPKPSSASLLAIATPLLLLLLWTITAMVRGFATVTGLSKTKLIVVGGGTLLIAEIGLKALLLSVIG